VKWRTFSIYKAILIEQDLIHALFSYFLVLGRILISYILRELYVDMIIIFSYCYRFLFQYLTIIFKFSSSKIFDISIGKKRCLGHLSLFLCTFLPLSFSVFLQLRTACVWTLLFETEFESKVFTEAGVSFAE